MHNIALAETRESIDRCYDVMRQLRTELSREAFIHAVLSQQELGYRLAYLESGGEVRAVAGYRISRCLAWGKNLYVDDLVTDADSRSQNLGSALFDWLVSTAKSAGCGQLHLDSGVQRHGAHKFYLNKRMIISSHHFMMKL